MRVVLLTLVPWFNSEWLWIRREHTETERQRKTIETGVGTRMRRNEAVYRSLRFWPSRLTCCLSFLPFSNIIMTLDIWSVLCVTAKREYGSIFIAHHLIVSSFLFYIYIFTFFCPLLLPSSFSLSLGDSLWLSGEEKGDVTTLTTSSPDESYPPTLPTCQWRIPMTIVTGPRLAGY